MTTSSMSCWTVFTGFRFRNVSSSSCVCWRSRRCTDSQSRTNVSRRFVPTSRVSRKSTEAAFCHSRRPGHSSNVHLLRRSAIRRSKSYPPGISSRRMYARRSRSTLLKLLWRRFCPVFLQTEVRRARPCNFLMLRRRRVRNCLRYYYYY